MSKNYKKKNIKSVPYRDLKELYKTLFEQAADGIFIANGKGEFIEVNQSGLQMLDYTREEMLNLSIKDLIPPKGLEGDPLQMEELQNGKILLKDRYLCCKDGRLLPVEINARMMDDGNFLGVVRDISKRKLTEVKLNASEERLQLAVDTAQIGLWDWNIVTGEVLWSDQCKAHYGIPPETQMSYERFLQALHPDDRESVEAALNRAVEEHSDYDKIKRTIWPDGSLHWTSSRGQVYCNTKGEPVRMVGVTFDITKQKRAEEEMINAHHELKRLFSFNEALLSAIPTPVFYKDKEGRYLGCNKAFSNFTGVSSDQIKGKTVMELWPSENAEVYHNKDLELMHNPEQQMYEFKVQDKNGEDHPVIFAKNVFHDENKQVAGIVGAFLDISERKRLEQEHLEHLRSLKSMDRINQAIQASKNLEQMMVNVLDIVQDIFDSDRAYLLYPCDPDSPTWTVPMERNKPEYPGAFEMNLEMKMDEGIKNKFSVLLTTDGPQKFGSKGDYPLPKKVANRFNIKSIIAVALYPKTGKPWEFGVQQCSYARAWSDEERRLIQEIGRRISDSLTSLLAFRNLRESEERYRMVFENSPVSIWEEDFSAVKTFLDDLKERGVSDIEAYFNKHPEIVHKCAELTRIIDVNKAALTLHKAMNKNELITDLINTFTPESFDTFRQELVCLWNEQTEMTRDAVVKTLEGDRRNVTVSFSVCPDYEETLSKVIVSLVDITERKRAEEEISQLNQELEQRVADRTEELAKANDRLKAEIVEHKKAVESRMASEEKYRNLVENINDVHFSLDRQGNFTYISPAITRFAHYEVEEVVGKPFTRFIHPDDLTELQESFAQTLRGVNASHEFRVLAKDGMVHYVRTSSRTQYEEGQVVGVTGIMTDITKRKYAEERVKRLNHDLQEHTFALEAANKELEAFAYSVSHDLRAPLRHIDGFLELLQQRTVPLLDEKSQHYMETISDAARRMGALIDDLLRFSRMGRQEMIKKRLDMNILVREIVQELDPDTQNRNIKWHIGKLPFVTGDRAMMSMVLSNLISNALKFTRQRKQAKIEIDCMQNNDKETVIYIRDNGVGFDPKYTDQLFNVFQRLHQVEEFEGTGVGLASVRRIINRHGGKTWAEGKLNKGATFYFSLPLLKKGTN